MQMQHDYKKFDLIRAIFLLFGIGAAFLAGVLISQNSLVPFILIAGLLWMVLCLRVYDFAILILGVSPVLLYLLNLQGDLFNAGLFGVYGLMISFIMLSYGKNVSSFEGNINIFLIIFVFGVFLWISQNISTSFSRGWGFRFFFTSSVKLIPYMWILLSRPRINGYNNDTRKNLLSGIAIGAFITAVVFLFNFRPWSSSRSAIEAWTDTYLIIGSLKNSLGLLWTIGVAIILNWHTVRWKTIKIFGLMVLIISIAYSFSRSSYLALLAVMLISSSGRFWRNFVLLLLLGCAASFLAPDVIWQRLLLTWSSERGLDISSATRVELWWAAINAFRDNPITGVGIGNFTEYLIRSGLMPSGTDFLYVDFTYAHSYFLSLFALTGIVGGVLGVMVFWLAYRRSNILKERGDTIAITVQACLAAFFVSSLYGDPLFDPVLLIVFIFIIGCLIPNES